MGGSSAFEFFAFGHGGLAEHVFFGCVVLLDMCVECGVGEVGFAAGADEVSTL